MDETKPSEILSGDPASMSDSGDPSGPGSAGSAPSRDASRPSAPIPVAITEAGVIAAARALCMRNAQACGVDFEDSWKFYSDDFKADARLALIAALNAPEPAPAKRGAEFDAAGFYATLDRARIARGATWRSVSKATGVSTTTLSRMSSGRRPDAASLAALSAWAGINPANYSPKRARGIEREARESEGPSPKGEEPGQQDAPKQEQEEGSELQRLREDAVPVATPAMLAAGVVALRRASGGDFDACESEVEAVWQAMLEESRLPNLVDALEIIAAQSSGVIGSTAKADCMAAIAAAVLNADAPKEDEGETVRLREDAARYRWLRGNVGWMETSARDDWTGAGVRDDPTDAASFDSYVDRAIAASEGSGTP